MAKEAGATSALGPEGARCLRGRGGWIECVRIIGMEREPGRIFGTQVDKCHRIFGLMNRCLLSAILPQWRSHAKRVILAAGRSHSVLMYFGAS